RRWTGSTSTTSRASTASAAPRSESERLNRKGEKARGKEAYCPAGWWQVARTNPLSYLPSSSCEISDLVRMWGDGQNVPATLSPKSIAKVSSGERPAQVELSRYVFKKFAPIDVSKSMKRCPTRAPGRPWKAAVRRPPPSRLDSGETSRSPEKYCP